MWQMLPDWTGWGSTADGLCSFALSINCALCVCLCVCTVWRISLKLGPSTDMLLCTYFCRPVEDGAGNAHLAGRPDSGASCLPDCDLGDGSGGIRQSVTKTLAVWSCPCRSGRHTTFFASWCTWINCALGCHLSFLQCHYNQTISLCLSHTSWLKVAGPWLDDAGLKLDLDMLDLSCWIFYTLWQFKLMQSA